MNNPSKLFRKWQKSLHISAKKPLTSITGYGDIVIGDAPTLLWIVKESIYNSQTSNISMTLYNRINYEIRLYSIKKLYWYLSLLKKENVKDIYIINKSSLNIHPLTDSGLNEIKSEHWLYKKMENYRNKQKSPDAQKHQGKRKRLKNI